MLSQFGAQTYRVTLEHAVTDLNLEFPHTVHGHTLTVTLPDADALYALFEGLRPHAVVNIEKLDADLGTVFRRVMHADVQP